MRYLTSMIVLTGVLSAQTASAQAPVVSGTWKLNIPQISDLPGTPVWTLTDTETGFDGTWVLSVPPYATLDGAMTGRHIWGPIYVADASFEIEVLVPFLPVPIPALPTVKALLLVNGNAMTGWSLQSLNGVPVTVVPVQGTRTGP